MSAGGINYEEKERKERTPEKERKERAPKNRHQKKEQGGTVEYGVIIHSAAGL